VKSIRIAEAQPLYDPPVHRTAQPGILIQTPPGTVSTNGLEPRPVASSTIVANSCGTSKSHFRGKHRLSDGEERMLADRIKAGDTAAYQQLILANLALVLRAVGEFKRLGIPRDDLIQEGNLALIRAARTFSPGIYPTRFATYALFWIRASLIKAVDANSTVNAVPERLHPVKSKYFRAVNKLEKKGPQNMDVIARCRADIDDTIRGPGMPRDSDMAIGLTRVNLVVHEAMGDQLSTDVPSSDREIANEEGNVVLEQALRHLSPFEAWVIRERFGLGGQPAPVVEKVTGYKSSGDNPNALVNAKESCTSKLLRSLCHRSYVDLGRDCGLSTHRVRQVERAALDKLRSFVVPRLGGVFLK
jgi:RNA polymerase primary sigma factor